MQGRLPTGRSTSLPLPPKFHQKPSIGFTSTTTTTSSSSTTSRVALLQAPLLFLRPLPPYTGYVMTSQGEVETKKIHFAIDADDQGRRRCSVLQSYYPHVHTPMLSVVEGDNESFPQKEAHH